MHTNRFKGAQNKIKKRNKYNENNTINHGIFFTMSQSNTPLILYTTTFYPFGYIITFVLYYNIMIIIIFFYYCYLTNVLKNIFERNYFFSEL